MTFDVKIALIVILGLSISACAGGNKKGPDEFSVLPTNALKYPSSLSELPEPDLTGKNLADKRPLDKVINALGGNANYQSKTQIRNSETALLKTTGRYGIISDIRLVTAKEDDAYRDKTKPKFLERWAGINIDKIRYRNELLDAGSEVKRLASLGVRTPTVPSKK